MLLCLTPHVASQPVVSPEIQTSEISAIGGHPPTPPPTRYNIPTTVDSFPIGFKWDGNPVVNTEHLWLPKS